MNTSNTPLTDLLLKNKDYFDYHAAAGKDPETGQYIMINADYDTPVIPHFEKGAFKNIAILEKELTAKLSDQDLLYLRDQMNPVPFHFYRFRTYSNTGMGSGNQTEKQLKGSDRDFIVAARENGLAFCTSDAKSAENPVARVARFLGTLLPDSLMMASIGGIVGGGLLAVGALVMSGGMIGGIGILGAVVSSLSFVVGIPLHIVGNVARDVLTSQTEKINTPSNRLPIDEFLKELKQKETMTPVDGYTPHADNAPSTLPKKGKARHGFAKGVAPAVEQTLAATPTAPKHAIQL